MTVYRKKKQHKTNKRKEKVEIRTNVPILSVVGSGGGWLWLHQSQFIIIFKTTERNERDR